MLNIIVSQDWVTVSEFLQCFVPTIIEALIGGLGGVALRIKPPALGIPILKLAYIRGPLMHFHHDVKDRLDRFRAVIGAGKGGCYSLELS